MIREEREAISATTHSGLFIRRVINSFARMRENRRLLAACIVIVIGIIVTYMNVEELTSEIWWEFAIIRNMMRIIIKLILPLLLLVSLKIIGTPWKNYSHRRGFIKAGIVNRAGEPPELFNIENDCKCEIYTYYIEGIPLAKFTDDIPKVEAALNLSILDITQGRNKKYIIIMAMNGEQQVPKYVEWEDYYIQGDGVLALGIGLSGVYTVDLNQSPHVQCGGSTGSGKTLLLKNVLYQLNRKGATIYLADFKGFVDFPFDTIQNYICISTQEELCIKLEEIISEMERRREIFRDSGCSNIYEYNKFLADKILPRIMLACDEAALMFLKRGLTGDAKKLMEKIENQVSFIAQQGRFAGIHLWLSTQRGDADTIPPQIRSNLTTRICGKANDILSQLTVGHSRASEISEYRKGLFVDEHEKFFQGFYMKNM